MSFKNLNVYVAFVAILAIAFLLLQDWTVFATLTGSDLAGLITFVALAILSQALAVESTVGTTKPVSASIAFLPLLALAVVLPPPAVAVAAGLSAITEVVVRRQRELARAVFNVCQIVLAHGLGSTVFHWIHGGLGTDVSLLDTSVTQTFVSFYVLAFVFFSTNIVLVVLYISIRDSQRVLPLLINVTGKGGSNLFYDLLASPIALLAAYLYVYLHVGGLLIVVLPLLLLRYSYLAAMSLDKANKDLLKVLIKAIETRDPYTSGHSQRVSTLAGLIAEDLGLRPSSVDQVERAALLHDIGKIEALYSDIISKEASLTDDEITLIKTHATKGADLLQALTSLEEEVILGVRHHHERYDGTGYPDGLIGKEIPVAARIIMLCDSVDAMLSDRPYRDALSMDVVRKELVTHAGFQFDPDIVATVLGNNTLERAELLVTRGGKDRSIQLPA
jgi:putative nucleotidyltransferase with HDIG domain